MTYSIQTTLNNIEEAYGIKFELHTHENSYVLISQECVDGKPVFFFADKLGQLRNEDAVKLHEKQSFNVGDTWSK